MREILFRGKRFDNDEWHTSYSIMKIPDFAYNQEPLVSLWDYESGWQRVYPETVGQFTGLTDKNGTRIFEGDVLSIAFDWAFVGIYKVVFECGIFGGRNECSFVTPSEFMLCEVIGNIHDNPELLEE